MASKSAQNEPVKAEVVEELLDTLDKTLDRVKVLYEQFFLGIQKQPPSYLHTDIERKLRELTQLQIRNTAQRYRFATLQQKFGSYNTYWRRTLRQIENGTYLRNLSKLSRQAAITGEEIPEEILAAMPKRMREQVKRDREAALALQRRRDAHADGSQDVDLGDALAPPAVLEKKTATGAHVLDDDDDFDLDAYFASVTNEDAGPAIAQATKELAATTKVPTFADAPPTTKMPTFPEATATTTHVPTFADAPATTKLPTFPERPATTQVPLPDTTTKLPTFPEAAPTMPIPRPIAPSQISRPIPVLPGAASGREASAPTAAGPFPRIPTANATPPMPTGAVPPIPPPPARAAGATTTRIPPVPATQPLPRAATPPVPTQPLPRVATPAPPRAPTPPPRTRAVPEPRVGPPPGMTDADVNALYAKYVQAKEAIGEAAGPGAYGRLLRTINAQAPKIMEQFKAKAVDFQVVVKDNQVVIRAKPKP